MQKELADTKAAAAAKDKELATAKTSLGEKDQAIQFWHTKATAKPDAAKPAEAEGDVDLLDVIGTKGKAGLIEVLKKSGDVVSRADVQNLIAGEVDRISREGSAVERFPELKDRDSELFKLMTKNLATLKGQGITGVNATEIAAERAYLQLVDDGKMDTKAQRAAKAKAAEDEEESEAERIARGAAAGGAGGRRASTGDRRPVETAEDKAMVARVCEGLGITEKQFRERAEKGVNYRD